MCAWIILVEFKAPVQELPCPELLKCTHESRVPSFSWLIGDLCDFFFSLLDVVTRDLLEFEVSGHIGGDENVCQVPIRHQELRDQVDIPVVRPPIFLPGLFSFTNIAIFSEQLEGR